MDHHLKKEISRSLAKITQSTAIKVLPLFGKNDKKHADYLAVEAMREGLDSLPFGVKIVLGEGEKDESAHLYEGEVLGNGEVLLDLIVDPLECTTNFSKGLPNSLSVLAYSTSGGIQPVPGTYMEQWLAGPKFKESFEPYDSLARNVEKLCDSLEKTHSELLVVVQDRPRHETLIRDLRNLGVGIALIDSGSITVGLDICLNQGHYDAMIGTYGAPEGLILAVVAKCTGSEMKGILRPHKESYKERWKGFGFEDGQVLDKSDFIKANFVGFEATIISTNVLARGIFRKNGNFHGNGISISNEWIELYEWEV